MSARICFIGDSHVAALNLSVRSDQSGKLSRELKIFGSRGDSLRRTFVRENLLTSEDEDVLKSFEFTGGANHIGLGDYEAFCVVGCRVNVQQASNIAAQYSFHKLGLPGRQLVSRELMTLMLKSLFKRSLAGYVIEMLSAATEKPIYYIPDPLWSPIVLKMPRGRILEEVASLGRSREFANWFFEAVTEAFADKATIVTQPPETVQDAMFTRPEYGEGSIRLVASSKEHPKKDFAHMNLAYGNKILETFFAAVEERRAA